MIRLFARLRVGRQRYNKTSMVWVALADADLGLPRPARRFASGEFMPSRLIFRLWPILLQNYFERSGTQYLFKTERQGAMLIQELPCLDSNIAGQLLIIEFCNKIGPSRRFAAMQ
jgi:hypothetical protein